MLCAEIYAVQKLCTGTVSDHSGEFFELNIEIFPAHVIPFMLISLDYASWLFSGYVQSVPEVIFLPLHRLPLQIYSTNEG
jgi:hypothetical protein